MSICSQDILNVAKELAAINNSEAFVRSSISRAYYSAYHEADLYHRSLPSLGSAGVGNFGNHETLCRALINPTVSSPSEKMKSKSVGYILRTLKSRRHDADYTLQIDIEFAVAEQTIVESELLIEKIKTPAQS